MDITWLGHAAFLVRSGSSTLLMDPFPQALGVRIPPDLARAAVVTSSHGHPYHSAWDELSDKPVVLSGPGEYEVGGFTIRGLRTPLGSGGSQEKTWNTIFVVEAEGLAVCHLGGLDSPNEARKMEALSSPQVLLVPVGGHGALSPAGAAELVNAIEPRIAVPMRYAHPGSKAELEPLAGFLDELGIKQPEAQGNLTVTKASLPAETRVVVLQPAATLL